MFVRLIGKPERIHEVLDVVWQVSKTDLAIDYEREPKKELLQRLIDEDVPVLRHFYFTFIIEDMPIEFREQLVRSQFDHYWIQSGRITDWSTLRVNEKIHDNPHLNNMQAVAVKAIRHYCAAANAAGVPPEEYRHLVPVGALHRGAWTANLQSILQRMKKRSCWVAQAEHWTDFLHQVKIQLEAALGINLPIRPPCRNAANEYIGCKFREVMTDRALGDDPLPTCPLFLLKEGSRLDFGEDWDTIPSPEKTLYNQIISRHPHRVTVYERMWNEKLPRS